MLNVFRRFEIKGAEMTQEQFKDIQEKLRVWREERGLSVEDQKKNFRVNYTKELLEYFEAELDDNKYKIIDSICDMAITAINAGFDFYVLDCIDDYTLPVFNIVNPLFDDNTLSLLFIELEKAGYNPYKCLLETIKELNSRTGSWSEEYGKWVKFVGAYTKDEAITKSKIQKIDEVYESDCNWVIVGVNEYQGIKTQETREVCKWYKADYDKCKLESAE